MTSGYRKRLDQVLSDYRHAKQTVIDEKQALKEAKEYHEATCIALATAQVIAEKIQNDAHRKVASVVTKCLRSILGEEYEFRINFVKRRNRTEAELLFVKDGREIDPLTSSGGGVIDIASFALRLSCLLLTQPPVRKLVVADEPFKWLSSEYVPAVKNLLLSLSSELGVQFIIVTHIKQLVCGKVIEIE